MDEAEIRGMSQAERFRLAELLAELDAPAASALPDGAVPRAREARVVDPFLDPRVARRRRLVLPLLVACCVILAGWIVLLAATLPHHFNAHYWRPLWVNFDVLELAALAATAWAIWRKRQVLILLLAITGTMLCCDAWFDVGTSLGTSGIWFSVADALCAELPLAFLFLNGARRLLKATVEAALAPAAGPGRVAAERIEPEGSPSLRRTPLSGEGLDEALPRRSR